MSKTRLAPLNGRTLPQLELTVIELGTWLATQLKWVFPELQETYVWTNSGICLYWVAKNDSGITYVKNRVNKKKKMQLNFRYFHVRSGQNPAD